LPDFEPMGTLKPQVKITKEMIREKHPFEYVYQVQRK
jgi:hypothetical protein